MTRIYTEHEPGEWCGEDIHAYFNLTYASYLVIPRSLLQSMPGHWQHQLVALLEDLQTACEGRWDTPSYRVQAVDCNTGRFMRDPIPGYDRGRTRLELNAVADGEWWDGLRKSPRRGGR